MRWFIILLIGLLGCGLSQQGEETEVIDPPIDPRIFSSEPLPESSDYKITIYGSDDGFRVVYNWVLYEPAEGGGWYFRSFRELEFIVDSLVEVHPTPEEMKNELSKVQ